jgi:fucose permease
MLLIILYLAFIGLGLPNALLGSAWPAMRGDLDVPVHYAGILAMLISGGTIFSSLMADNITKKIRPGLVVALSVFFIGAALLGFSLADSFWVMCLLAVPLGLGSGSLDAVINNYIAVHYSSRHMNWLHCFWGFGSMVGPYIMGFYLTRGMTWSYGYSTVALMQGIIFISLISTLHLWKKGSPATDSKSDTPDAPAKGLLEVIRIRGVIYALLAFFAYCALESTAGLWASTYLVYHRNVSAESAALFASFFFIGITAGRIMAGFVSNRLGDWKMVLIGLSVVFIGVAAVWLPFAPTWVCLAGLIIIGLGCAPVFPALMHATPANFGTANSQALVGVQMAAAYTGSTLIPPLFGWISTAAGIGSFPVFLFIFFVLTVGMAWGLINKI